MGVTRFGYRRSAFRPLDSHSRPCSEQERIAAYLDASCAAIDAAVAAKRRQIADARIREVASLIETSGHARADRCAGLHARSSGWIGSPKCQNTGTVFRIKRIVSQVRLRHLGTPSRAPGPGYSRWGTSSLARS